MATTELKHVGVGNILQWEATNLSRVSVPCGENVKAGQLVPYALVNRSFPALKDAENGKTVIQPLNCVIDGDFVLDDNGNKHPNSQALAAAWLSLGVSLINGTVATENEQGGGE